MTGMLEIVDQGNIPEIPLGPESYELLGIPVASIKMQEAIDIVSSWVGSGLPPRLVTFSTVHMLVEGYKNPIFHKLLREMDMNCPDGMPLVWMGRLRSRGIDRVCGPDFMPEFCAATADRGYRHFFYGGADGVAEEVIAALKEKSPSLQIAGHYTPPFRPLTSEEDEAVTQLINESNPDFVWVCLGCPKQEHWIAQHRRRISAAALLAVGMAFDTTAGKKKRAPKLVRKLGIEWLHRLFQEPGRLWRRYLVYNSLFLGLIVRELFSPSASTVEE